MATEHNKLVRDKILAIIAANGGVATSRTLDDDQEFLRELCAKLVEEAKEVAADPSLGELADVLEVFRTIARELGYSMDDVEEMRLKKLKRGVVSMTACI
jgi:predicted house-cleaning noncanonical NTP pyrophosphatase (MazG superfamily)